jgi:hypothetical protein
LARAAPNYPTPTPTVTPSITPTPSNTPPAPTPSISITPTPTHTPGLVLCPNILIQPQSVLVNTSPAVFTVGLDIPTVGTTYQWQYQPGPSPWLDMVNTGPADPGIAGATTDTLTVSWTASQPLWVVRVIVTTTGCPTLTSTSALTWT